MLANGYHVLTRSPAAGVDAFAKEQDGGSLFVFLQGHPEYDAQSLMLEYRRDIRRFLIGERDTYPTMPHGYFDELTVERLTRLHARALVDRREQTLDDFPTELAAAAPNTWRSAAVELYRNWLHLLCAMKTPRIKPLSPGGINVNRRLVKKNQRPRMQASRTGTVSHARSRNQSSARP